MRFLKRIPSAVAPVMVSLLILLVYTHFRLTGQGFDTYIDGCRQFQTEARYLSDRELLLIRANDDWYSIGMAQYSGVQLAPRVLKNGEVLSYKNLPALHVSGPISRQFDYVIHLPLKLDLRLTQVHIACLESGKIHLNMAFKPSGWRYALHPVVFSDITF